MGGASGARGSKAQRRTPLDHRFAVRAVFEHHLRAKESAAFGHELKEAPYAAVRCSSGVRRASRSQQVQPQEARGVSCGAAEVPL